MFMKLWNKLKRFFGSRPTIPAPQGEVPKYIPEYKAPDRGKIKLGVIVGHTKKAPGAALVGTGLYEYQYNTEVAKLVKELAESESKGHVIVEIIYRDGVGIAGAYQIAKDLGCDVVIELHFNAYNGKVAGTETLCTQASNDVEFAHEVQKAMCSIFNRVGMSRGVKVISASARGGGNVHAFKDGANCLVEPFFGDNPSEVQMAIKLKSAYASALVRAVLIYARKKDFIW